MNLTIDDKLDVLAVAEAFSVDTEGINRLLGISVAFDGPWEGFYFPIDHNQATGNLSLTQRAKLYKVLDYGNYWVMHNAAHDLRFLKKFGIDYRGKFYDTMLMTHWLDEEMFAYDLTSVSKAWGGRPKNMPQYVKDYIATEGWDNTPISWMDEYSANDAFITWQAFKEMKPKFEQEFPQELWATEEVFIRDVMIPMMERGVALDLDFASKKYIEGVERLKALEKELGFKPSSPKALARVLIDEMGLPVVRHTSSCSQCKKRQPVSSHQGSPSFDKTAMQDYETKLEHVNDDRATKILEYKGWQKTTSSNYKPYLELAQQGILRPGYKLHGTRTGRLSCEKPNLQQIPKSSDKPWNGDLKRAFVPREGFGLWTVDFSQLQFRMACAYARQENLIEVFNQPDRDIFTEMAGQLGWERQTVKTLVYLTLFGGGAGKAADSFGISIHQAKVILDRFYARYPNLTAVAKEAEKVARQLGYVTYWTGRRRHFRNGTPYYRAFNAVIQGGEAEIIKRCMIALQKELCNDECFLVLQIHDEVVFEIATGREDYYLSKAQEIMSRIPEDFNKFVGVNLLFTTDAKEWGKK